MADADSQAGFPWDTIGLWGPAAATFEVRSFLASQGRRIRWMEGAKALSAKNVIWVVDVLTGVPEGTKELFREAFEVVAFERRRRSLDVFLTGIAGVPVEQSFLPDLVELDVRDLLAGLGIAMETDTELLGEGSIRLLSSDRERPHDIDRSYDIGPIESNETLGAPWDSSPVTRGAVSREPDAWVIPVFYATDRERTGKSSPEEFFGPGRGTLSFGAVEVSLPVERAKGEMPTPSWWKPWQDRQDPSRFVLLLSVTPKEKGTFVTELRQAVNAASVPEALVFVHGFKVPFAEAAERAAQIAVDLEFPGVPVLYSWPSEGKVLSYTVDENNVTWSAPHFEEFLRLMLAESGARTVHVVAHSMGNRALAPALAALQARPPASGGSRLRQVVFAAPDIDRDTFEELATQFHGAAERFTLYGSSHDRALQISKLFHRYPRAGQSGEELTIADDLDSIDSSAADTSLLGHSYYGSKRSILADISLLLRHGFAPGDRYGLMPRQRETRKYWVYQP